MTAPIFEPDANPLTLALVGGRRAWDEFTGRWWP